MTKTEVKKLVEELQETHVALGLDIVQLLRYVDEDCDIPKNLVPPPPRTDGINKVCDKL